MLKEWLVLLATCIATLGLWVICMDIEKCRSSLANYETYFYACYGASIIPLLGIFMITKERALEQARDYVALAFVVLIGFAQMMPALMHHNKTTRLLLVFGLVIVMLGSAFLISILIVRRFAKKKTDEGAWGLDCIIFVCILIATTYFAVRRYEVPIKYYGLSILLMLVMILINNNITQSCLIKICGIRDEKVHRRHHRHRHRHHKQEQEKEKEQEKEQQAEELPPQQQPKYFFTENVLVTFTCLLTMLSYHNFIAQAHHEFFGISFHF